MSRSAGRRGITPDLARTLARTNTTVIGALAVRRGDADALICGLEGRFRNRLDHIKDIIGLAPGAHDFAALSLVITSRGAIFIADTHVQRRPDARRTSPTRRSPAPSTCGASASCRTSRSSRTRISAPSDAPSALKMREALALVRERAPELEIDGEMQADTALSETIRERVYPASSLKGEANVLIMPNLDAANIAFQFAKVLADALPGRPDPDRPGEARPRADAVGDGARHRQHHGRRGGRGAGRRALSAGREGRHSAVTSARAVTVQLVQHRRRVAEAAAMSAAPRPSGSLCARAEITSRPGLATKRATAWADHLRLGRVAEQGRDRRSPPPCRTRGAGPPATSSACSRLAREQALGQALVLDRELQAAHGRAEPGHRGDGAVGANASLVTSPTTPRSVTPPMSAPRKDSSRICSSFAGSVHVAALAKERSSVR